MQKRAFWHHPQSIANLGGCTAAHFVPWVVYKYSRTGTGIGWSANFAETMDEMFAILAMPIVIWGGLPDRMYALASAYARCGMNVIVGPVKGQRWDRLLSGNKWDYQRFWWYDAIQHKKRFNSPCPKGLIFPVETKEEVVTRLAGEDMKPIQPFIMRMVPNEYYFGWHKEYFGEMPDDWVKYVRTFTDLPATMRFELIEDLQNKYGWVVYGLLVDQLPHPDGRMLSQKDFLDEYGKPCSSYTKLGRLLIRPAAARRKKAQQVVTP